MAQSTAPEQAPVSTTNEVSAFIARHIDIQQKAGRSLADIARDAGFTRANVISMFKSGTAKVPLARVPMLAASLNVQPATLFRLAMLQHWPELHHVVAKLFGDVTTPNERELLGLLRFVSRNADPKLSDRQKRAIERILAEGP